MKLCLTKNNYQRLWQLPSAGEDWKNWSQFSFEIIKSDLFIHLGLTVIFNCFTVASCFLLNLSFTPHLQNITLVCVEHCSDSLHWLTAVLIHAEINMRLRLNLGYYCFPVLFKRFVYISSACRRSRKQLHIFSSDQLRNPQDAAFSSPTQTPWIIYVKNTSHFWGQTFIIRGLMWFCFLSFYARHTHT